MCITGPSAGENRWMEVDGESRKAVGFPYPTGLSFTSRDPAIIDGLRPAGFLPERGLSPAPAP